jgi:peroxiredoxin Q/BCP
MSEALAPGAKAPSFDLPTADGGRASLSALKGKTVVLYFYPKDDTTGCTQEAIDFTAKAGDFEALGAIVIGVSRDDPDTHRKFIAKRALSLTLASDVDGAACAAYGVWVEKNMYGRAYMGIERSTFLIDRSGRVREVWRKVKVAGHADQVLAAARALAEQNG